MSQMSVTEAVRSRRAVREFSEQAVAQALLEEIILLAGAAPSGSNTQPWKVYVLSGAALEEALDKINQNIYSGEMEPPEFPTYPEPLGEPYRERRANCGERMYQALEIPREDKGARVQQVLKNFRFFGAPVGIIVTMDRSMGEAQALDIGIYLQTLMLLARERGLDTCPQVSWTLWPGAVRAALGLDQQEKIMVGLSLGYADKAHPVNHLKHPRAPLQDFARFSGFPAQSTTEGSQL